MSPHERNQLINCAGDSSLTKSVLSTSGIALRPLKALSHGILNELRTGLPAKKVTSSLWHLRGNKKNSN